MVDCQDGGSELPNELHGVVVSKESRPAANVKVGLYSVNYIPADSGNPGMVWTTRTDAVGNYAFKNIPSGRYNVVGTQDSLGFYRDSISVSSGAEVGRDSLGLLGTLSGRVQLQPQDEPRNAVVQVMGTDNYINVDSAGAFTLSGLAGGSYRLRVSVALPNYVPLFANVQVHGGRHDTLSAPLVPFFSGIPVVLDIRTYLDTARGIAKITWHPVAYPALLTYLVYRDPENAVALSNTPINAARLTDSIYYDTLYKYDAQTKTWDDTLPQNWEYRVRVEGKNTKIGEPFKPGVLHALAPLVLSTRISIGRSGGKIDEIFKGDTVLLIATYSNAMVANRSLAWIHGASDTLRKADIAGKNGRDTLVWIAPSTPGTDSLRMIILDANGMTWSETVRITAVNSRMIGNLKSVSYGISAYPWNGGIVHVNMDSLGRLVIGRFNLATKQDSILNTTAKADTPTYATALWGSKLFLLNARHPDFPGANVLTFDFATGAWGKETNLTASILLNSAVAANGKLYSLGNHSVDTIF